MHLDECRVGLEHPTIYIFRNNQLQYARLSSSLVHSDVFPFYPSGDSVVTLEASEIFLVSFLQVDES